MLGSFFLQRSLPPGAVTGFLFFFGRLRTKAGPRKVRLRGEASRGAAPNRCRAKGAAPPGSYLAAHMLELWAMVKPSQAPGDVQGVVWCP